MRILNDTLLTRRTVLATAAILPLVPLFASVLPAAATIIIDEVGLHAAAVARHASLRARIHWLKPDLAQMYFQEIAPQWHAHGAQPLLGFTRAAPAYILEQLALEFGQRLVYAQKLEFAADSSRDGRIADVLDRLRMSTPSGRRPPGQPPSLQPLANRDPLHEALLAEEQTLFAWCLAPVRKSILTPNHTVAV